MKTYSLLLALLFFIGIVTAQAAKKEKLLSMKDKETGIVRLNSQTYDRFVEGKRDYGIVVLLTALDPQFNCVPCREFEPEYTLVSESFQKNKHKDDVIFSILDFKDGQAVFQRLKLMSAPSVYYFPPQAAGENKGFNKYDIARNLFAAEPFAEFMSSESGYNVVVNRPLDYKKLAVKVCLAIGAAALLKFMYRHFQTIFSHKLTWTIFSIIFILTFTSGFMWNRIRTPLFVSPGKNGEINYIQAGFQAQLGVETQIVASIYGVLAFSLIALIKTVPRFPDPIQQRFGVYLWVGCIIFIYSCFFVIFKIKNGGYPFRLLL